MELSQEKSARYWSKVELMDALLSYKIDSKTFMDNENMVKTLCDCIDRIDKKEKGYLLYEISVGNLSALKLLVKTTAKHYHCYSWTLKRKIEAPIGITIHEEASEDLDEIYDKIVEKASTHLPNKDELMTHIIGESLTGFCITKKGLTDHLEFLSQNDKKYNGDRSTNRIPEAWGLYDFITSKCHTTSQDIRKTISSYAQRLDCDKLRCTINTPGIDLSNVGIGKIVKVKQAGNSRTFQVDYNSHRGEKISGVTVVDTRNAGVKSDSMTIRPIGNLSIAEIRSYSYQDEVQGSLSRIPYELVDEGRILVAINRGNYWNLIIGPDPRAQEENPVDNLKRILDQYIDTILKKSLTIDASIKNGEQTYLISTYENVLSKEQPDIKPLQLKLKALKRMVDEYQYIGKKEKAKGQDVTVTDKIKYNHTNGEVSYNDFSFSVDDEMIKSSFMNMFNHYIVEYYRGTLSEEQILNDILAKIFEAVKSRINSYSNENNIINIKMNNAVNVKLGLATSKNNSRLIYINDQRFNKNEVVTVLREMTCYRNQAEADMFIKNIGKIGLSVYIAVSTGYEVKFKNRVNGEESTTRLFKFRKNKGRSNYSLILDTVEIEIVGKSLINTLYSQFIGEYVPDFEKKIPKFIMDSVKSSLDYAKYKFLIDSTYEAFQKNSIDFLSKKVADMSGSFCKYYNAKNGKILDAIGITGTSGNLYIIAYDKTNSWVFMNPEKKDDSYRDGKYVCMIDQSNIKSNIGYDTVIAKLMALKNDSVIAGKIYNLKEEIDG